ncbi:MAG: AsmA family protein [Gammaproteobacteria bacterium]
MGKLIKLLLSLLLLVVIIAISLPFIIDPNDYRDEIVTAVEDATGRKLNIEGDLKLSVFPWVGIELGKMDLSNAAGFGDKPFAAINSAAVRIKLVPLFSKELVADTITLDGLQLNLAKNAKGVTNWDDLAKSASKPAAKTEEKPKEESGTDVGLMALAIGGISIENATINWQDDATGQSYQVHNFYLNSGAIFPGEPVDLDLGLDLKSAQPAMTANLGLNGTVAVDSDMEKLTVLPLKVSVNAEGDMFTGGGLKADLSTDLSVNLKELAVSLQKLLVTSGDLKLSGAVEMTNLSASPQVAGDLKLAKLNLKSWLQSQGIVLPEMSNPDAMSSFEAGLKLNTQGETIAVNAIDIALDQSKITGDAKLVGPQIGFNLNVDQINVDHYLPKPESGSAAKADSAPATSSPAPAASAGDAKPTSVKASNLTSEQITLGIKAKNGVVNIDNKIGRFYQGSFNGKSSLNVNGKTPKLTVNANLKDLQAEPLLKDLADFEKLTGQGKFNMAINANGNSVDALKKTLGGNLDFRFENGAVKGVNLAKIIRDTKAKFEGKPVAASNEPQQTDFSELSGSAKITNGVVNNQDLLAKSPYLRVKGAGTVDLPKEAMNYTVETTIVGTDKGQGGEELKELEGLNIPVKITGSFNQPKYTVDWGKVLQGQAKEKVKEKVEEKLNEKLKDGLGDKLKGFF